MKKRIILVVGDKFMHFCQGKDAISLSQLRGLLSLSIPFLPSAEVTLLVPGQGLGDQAISSLLEEAASSPNAAHFDFSLWHDLPTRASSAVSHKHFPQNTLISEPQRISAEQFTAALLIDENCELMSDHQTGQHVQGMILIEATRQALLAIAECFLLPKGDTHYAFVLSDLAIRYSHYTFPVSAVIRCKIIEVESSNTRRLSYLAEVDILQCEQVVSTLTVKFEAMDHLRIAKREGMLSSKVHADFVGKIEQQFLDEVVVFDHVVNH